MTDLQLLNGDESTEVTIVDASVVEAQMKAEIDIQIQTANRFPRDLQVAKRNAVSLVTMDEETAKSCWYALPRSGKEIEGPSVGLARILIGQYKNLRASAQIVDIGDKFITARSFCHDLENNVAVGVEVKRRITDSKGRRYGDDMITVTGNAANAIALRNAVFNIIPQAFTNAVMNAAKDYVAGGGDEAKFQRQVTATVNHFKKHGVSDEQLCQALQLDSLESMDRDAFIRLTGIGTAIKNGDTSLAQAFPLTQQQKSEVKGASATQAAEAALNKAKK